MEKKGVTILIVGKRIKQRRKELGMSADELAKQLGKDRSTIYRYEKGDIENMPLDILEPIAKVLRTTPQFLMGWEEVQKNNNVIADIVVRLRTDDDFFKVVKRLNELEPDKLSGLMALLK